MAISFKERVLDLLFSLLLSLLYSILITYAVAKVTGNWMNVFSLIPNTLLNFFLIFCIPIGIIFLVIFLRVRQLRKLNSGPKISVIQTAPYGWTKIGEHSYKGLLWNIQIPTPSPYSLYDEDLYGGHLRSSIEIETPPRCPRCKTEIEQIHSFWTWYVWKCAMCGFKKRNSHSYYQEKDRVLKIARRSYELEVENKSRKRIQDEERYN